MEIKLVRIRYAIATILALILFAGSTHAQEEPTLTTAVDYEFGQVIRFQINAEDVAGAESVILFFRPEGSENTYTDEAVVNFATRFTVEHEIDLTQLRIDPFTEVQYWWLIPTEEEDIFTPTETFFYEDDQFEWQFLQDGPITVHWTGEDSSLGQTAVDVAQETLINVRPFIPDATNQPLSIYIYPTAADLRAALRLSGRDWVGGHASPDLGVILVTAVNVRTATADLRRSIPHEMVHVLLHQTVTVNGAGRLPVWFNEGLATYVEESQNPNYEVLLETAVEEQATIPFVELCETFPTTEEQAVLAYAQSSSFVAYLQSRFGNQALGQIILAHRDGADCQAGVARALQISLIDLNEDWLEQLEPPTPLAYFFDVTGFWLLLILAGFGITGLLVLRPSRE